MIRLACSHPWEVSLEEAIAIQNQLRKRLRIEDDFPDPPAIVGGVDVGFPEENRARAAVVVLAFPSLGLAGQAVAERVVSFPYIPGFLSFREIPAVLAALERLPLLPDVLLCDGQGIAHPRRMGIAAHLGVILDHPTVGVGKSRLCGHHEPVPDEKGAWVPLIDRGEVVGAVVRTRKGVKPIYVSPGHRIGLESAVRLVLDCTTRYRLPETIRLAHRLASGR